jgi:hypothetical protein
MVSTTMLVAVAITETVFAAELVRDVDQIAGRGHRHATWTAADGDASGYRIARRRDYRDRVAATVRDIGVLGPSRRDAEDKQKSGDRQDWNTRHTRLPAQKFNHLR